MIEQYVHETIQTRAAESPASWSVCGAVGGLLSALSSCPESETFDGGALQRQDGHHTEASRLARRVAPKFASGDLHPPSQWGGSDRLLTVPQEQPPSFIHRHQRLCFGSALRARGSNYCRVV